QLLQDAEEPNASHDSMDAIIARELILFDSGEAMHLSESQFKCQNEVLLNKAKMENFHSPFVIAAFKFRSSGESNCDYSFALTEFEYHFPNSFSLVNRGIMYAFFFDCQCESWNELDNFSYQHQLYAGVSDFFDSLENRHFFKLQAKELLQLAENTKDKKYLCLYFDHYSELMLLNASDRFGAHMLILSDVRRLAKLDKEGGTLYLDTLEQYLLCRNIPSAAAKALFIDRGTLRYRLQKILDTLNIDFESPTYAKALFASIQLFRLCPS
ncbi:MAG: helix-turn-helix domain-containing protein, partial [Oscillospiraceae bacterium]